MISSAYCSTSWPWYSNNSCGWKHAQPWTTQLQMNWLMSRYQGRNSSRRSELRGTKLLHQIIDETSSSGVKTRFSFSYWFLSAQIRHRTDYNGHHIPPILLRRPPLDIFSDTETATGHRPTQNIYPNSKAPRWRYTNAGSTWQWQPLYIHPNTEATTGWRPQHNIFQPHDSGPHS